MTPLSRRVGKPEARPGVATLRDAIDRPPQETREQWLAHVAGRPAPGLVNTRGETFGDWITRRQRELDQSQSKESQT